MDVDGGNVTRLTHDFTNDTNPAVSPDGTKIAYSFWNGRDYDIYEMNMAGTVRKRLTWSPLDDDQAVYSFDGQKIFFTGHNSLEIRRMDADGKNNIAIMEGPGFRPAVWQALP